MSDARLIERWLPIAALGEESVRERRSMTALPPTYYLHVWWARRPLVASRAAVLASILPESFEHSEFLPMLGILGDPVSVRRRIDNAKKSGADLGSDPYGYKRAFSFHPLDSEELKAAESLLGLSKFRVLDPTAGGGSIPFEAYRLGTQVLANDINPVACTILEATTNYPAQFGSKLVEECERLTERFVRKIDPAVKEIYAQEAPGSRVDAYLWAFTVPCPHCDGIIPLSLNWRLGPGGSGVKLHPVCEGTRTCNFEIVESLDEQSAGTVSSGSAKCPYPDCGRVVEAEEIKRVATTIGLGEQLFAIATKQPVKKRGKNGKERISLERVYRAPRREDDTEQVVRDLFERKADQWSALNILPTEDIPEGFSTSHPRSYGMKKWINLFSARQLLIHGCLVETFQSLYREDEESNVLTPIRKAAFVYLSFSLDKLRDYNSRMSRWHSKREVIANTFDTHDFSIKWAHAEMPVLNTGQGLQWVLKQTIKSVRELVELVTEGRTSGPLFNGDTSSPREVTVSCKSGADLQQIASASIDAVVMDPPYGANVMYAELSDFFYVWLKRTAGHVLPAIFTRPLTDKENEAVANKSKFEGQSGSAALANRDYQEKMASIFTEGRRVLKPNGIMTVMFTHKDTSAWDALTKGLIEAGFIITASWPVNTEAEGSLHIKDKAAANSTIFLVCRPRPADQGDETTYWEDVEPLVAKAVRTRVEEFQKAGIGGVDLYLASFGPALEEFSRHWPLKRGTPRPEPLAKKRRKQAELFEEEFDPYAVTPEDALDAARREVKTWRLNQLTHTKGRGDLDATTSWFVLAWDAFKAPVFSYDEGLRLARAVGADLEGQLIGKICEKKGSDIKLWDSATRAAKSGLGPADGSRAMIDAIHHAAHRGRTRTLDAAVDLLKEAGIENDPQFLAALEAVLEVLPPSRSFVGFDVATGDAKSAADDFDALEKLRRLAFSDRVNEPLQLSLFAEETA